MERRIRSEVVSDFGTWLRGIHFVSLFAHLPHSRTKERPSQGYTFKKVWTRNDKLSGFICGRSFEGNQLFKGMSSGAFEDSFSAVISQQWECCSVSCDCVCALTLTDLFVATDVSQCTSAIENVMACDCCPTCSSVTTKSLAEHIVQSHALRAAAVSEPDDEPDEVTSLQSELVCSICNQVFCKRANLLRHQNTVHSRGPRLVCSLCNETFSRKDSLARHHTRKHG